MKCWICGNPADSGEHKLKASDIRLYVGDISQKQPIIFGDFHGDAEKIGSPKSKKLHFNRTICKQCNSERTQPSDRAWESLSSYIRDNVLKIMREKEISLKSISVENNQGEFLTNVQLYFVKLFGCMINDLEIPICLNNFSQAIMKNEAHKSIYLMFHLSTDSIIDNDHLYISDMRAFEKNGKIIYAAWQYCIGQMIVFVIYDPEKSDKKIIRNSMHPRRHCDHIRCIVKNNKAFKSPSAGTAKSAAP